MGASCNCGNEKKDIITFWKNMQIRNFTFENYQKLYEDNKKNWLTSGKHYNQIDIRNCNELLSLLDSSDFSNKERSIYIEELNKFINKFQNKLIFFSCLAFFTKLEKNEKKINEKIMEKKSEKIFENIMRSALEKNDHDSVTKLFLEFLTVFPLNFLNLDKKNLHEFSLIYSDINREKLFLQLKVMNLNKFYEYMFNIENIALIQNDLIKIQLDYYTKEIRKEKTEGNLKEDEPEGIYLNKKY